MQIPDRVAIHEHTAPVLFIGDLHLDPENVGLHRAFIAFCRDQASRAGALYILGDLFEVWIGDDDDAPQWQPVRSALRHLTTQGVPVRFLPGNRDFLVGERFANETGIDLLPDPVRIDLFGVETVLTHGDLLCTADTAHQAFRETVQSNAWRQEFLARPLAERRAIARQMRSESRGSVAGKAARIMDVDSATVERVMQEAGVSRLIHGHTHRPAHHVHRLRHSIADRWVLGDWYEQASMLSADTHGIEMVAIGPVHDRQAD